MCEDKWVACCKLKEESQEAHLCELLDAIQKAHVQWITEGDRSSSFFANITKAL